MKRIILFSLMALMTVATFGRKHVENATVVATVIKAINENNITRFIFLIFRILLIVYYYFFFLVQR